MRQCGYSHIGKVKQGGWWQVVVAAASAAHTWYQGRQAKKKAGGTAESNVQLIRKETEQTLRRFDKEAAQSVELAKAAYHAGNVRMFESRGTGYEHSASQAIIQMRSEIVRQRGEFITSQRLREAVARRQGSYVGQGSGTQAALTLGRGIANYYAGRAASNTGKTE